MLIKREYYCLIAGLPDLFFDENKPTVTGSDFREELQHQLSQPDFKLVEYLFLPFDNRNLLNVFFGQNKPFFYPGNITKHELESQLSPENEEIQLPEYMKTFLCWMKGMDKKQADLEDKNILTTLFFEYALKCPNSFLQNWFRFELNLKNIFTAFNCKKYNYEPEIHLLEVEGECIVYSLLIENKLKADYFEELLPYHEELFKIAESNRVWIEKEKAVDKIKWEYLDENTFFHFFTIEKVLAFTIKLLLIERWMKMDKETGKKLLHKLIDELKTNYEFPAEFSLTK
ncbi:DUF2764 family protein [Draconibacterium sediminis]|uniref:DUF2764 domain-containing protein n=1 Tax=Draconibacterium sediminis TaxID=1544798 RepID=A0A0D8J5N6_9BACT|nr:DUF2764 family protein [Draconibacterium sediminis]KJF42084.1 hypothetical protein LH29_22690 [Draconibacterium sediminis]